MQVDGKSRGRERECFRRYVEGIQSDLPTQYT